MNQEILTVSEVAKVLKVEPVTVLRRIRAKQIEAFRTNGDSGPYRVTSEALARYMTDGARMVEVAQ
jgi:excisionase family DNA binding protein